MKTTVRILVLLTAGAAAAFGIVKWHAYQTGLRQRSEQVLTLYGNVEIRRVNLGFRTSGRIEKIAFEEGDSVHKGDRIAVLDKAPAEAGLASAEARLASAEANLARLENGDRPQEIEQAKARLQELRATLAFAEVDYERNKSLAVSGGTSISERDKSLSVRDETAAKILQAEENLSLLEEGYRKEDIAAARAQKAEAESELARAKITLADTELVSPSDGILLNRIEETGAVIQASQTVAILSLNTDVWIYVYIDESDLGKLSPGAEVRILTDSSDKVYTGQIGYISPEAEFTPKNVETEKLRTDLVYRVRIIANDPDNGLRQGMPVTVVIPLDQSGNTCPAGPSPDKPEHHGPSPEKVQEDGTAAEPENI